MEANSAVVTHVEHKGISAKIEGEPHRWMAQGRFTSKDGLQYGINVGSSDVFDLGRMWAKHVEVLEREHPDIFAEWQAKSKAKEL